MTPLASTFYGHADPGTAADISSVLARHLARERLTEIEAVAAADCWTGSRSSPIVRIGLGCRYAVICAPA